ncbi:MAG TPA: ATP-binding protein [Candidatus Binatia bacterium]|jgi:signal transduction histidine kinase
MKIAGKIHSLLFQQASLTTRFAVHSFICIGVMTVVLWFLVSDYLVNGILRREWETTAQFVRTEVKEFLRTEDFTAKDRKSVGPKFAALLRHITLMPDILRFNVYNSQGVAIWAAVDKQLVGRSFADNDKLREAIQGKVVADLSSLSRLENISEYGAPRKVVEVFIPVYSDAARELLGVMEIYKRADPIERDIREARLVVLLGALCGGLLLYFSLFAIVRQAARKIKEQEENLLKVQADLVASQRMAAVGEIAAAVAHGIGNPLSSIRAAAQVAKLDFEECEGPDLRRKTLTTLDEIIQQVDRVQKRMRGLLNFAKPMEPRPASVEINSLLQDIVHVLEPRFVAAGVNPQFDLDKSVPEVQLDVSHLEQIFMGLVTNALEATPHGGRVTIRTDALKSNGSPTSIKISVEDTGEGIPVDSRERVFDPFFTTKPDGTGIGLPLAKKFVERNGGKIIVSDGASGGAKFEVVFPLGRSS